MVSAKRLGLIAASTVISAGTALGLGATAASAATPNFCDGNYLCANVAAQTYSELYIHVWSAKDTFRGHFQLQTPEHTSQSSANTLNGPNDGPTFPVPIVYGWYCVTAWKEIKVGDYTKLGYECFVAGA
ncbi:MAG TPA: hypothetical protein VHW06_20075 [Streptosporangiaceae bacterium]|jgi:hypothetical protein|nr:hypothetical protein [Streptosporangiaceae bacterium]